MTSMFSLLLKMSAVDEAGQLLLQQLIKREEWKKGHAILRIGQVDTNMYFVVQGSGRVYYSLGDKDVSDYIAMDGQFLGGVESLFTGEPSKKGIELTEDSIIEWLNYAEFENACAANHSLEKLGRKLATFAFLEAQRRIETLRFLSAAERYEELERKYPGISNRIPLKHLASYLGTTQVSLSRIRAGEQ